MVRNKSVISLCFWIAEIPITVNIRTAVPVVIESTEKAPTYSHHQVHHHPVGLPVPMD
jgi:hypothetical protein